MVGLRTAKFGNFWLFAWITDYRDGKCGSFWLSLGGLGSQVRKTWRERIFAWGGLQNGKNWLFLVINRQNLVKKRKGIKSGLKWWLFLRKTVVFVGRGSRGANLGYLGGSQDMVAFSCLVGCRTAKCGCFVG